MALIFGYLRQDQLSDFSPLRQGYDYEFYNNIYYKERGFTFEDVLELYFTNNGSYLKAEFGGNRVAYTDTRNGLSISGGTFTGFKLKEWNGSVWEEVYGIAGFSVSAEGMFSAVNSKSRDDDRSITKKILSGNDRFELSNRDDIAYGFGGNDVMLGRGGSDYLDGGVGNDIINGGTGNDIIIGGAGGDRLTGSAGADTFRYRALSDSRLSAYDRITDFAIGTDIFDAPRAVISTNIKQLGRVSALTQAGIEKVLGKSNSSLGKQVFASHRAATFTVGTGGSVRTFLGVNDATAGFDQRFDALVEITGYNGSLANLAIV